MEHRRFLLLPLLGLSFALVGCSIPNTGGDATSAPAFGASSSIPAFGQSSDSSSSSSSSQESSSESPSSEPTYSSSSSVEVFSSQEQGNATFTVTDLPAFASENDRVLFAWAWPDGAEGNWYSCLNQTYSDSGFVSSVSFSVPFTPFGMLLASAYAGTTVPDWSIMGPVPGALMAQTYDILVEEGVTTYSAPEDMWMIRIFE